MVFGMVAVDELPVSLTVLRRHVAGQDCPTGSDKYGSYERAMQRAIASAPGANALTNARFNRFFGPHSVICVTVLGDAVRI